MNPFSLILASIFFLGIVHASFYAKSAGRRLFPKAALASSAFGLGSRGCDASPAPKAFHPKPENRRASPRPFGPYASFGEDYGDSFEWNDISKTANAYLYHDKNATHDYEPSEERISTSFISSLEKIPAVILLSLHLLCGYADVGDEKHCLAIQTELKKRIQKYKDVPKSDQ